MLSEDFEIFYYSDTAPSSVSDHTHDYYEFYFFMEGDVEMVIGDTSHPLSYGNLLIIPPGVKHHITITDNTTPYRRFVFWISTNYMNDLTTLYEDYGYILSCMEKDNSNVFEFDEFSFGLIQSRVFELIEETHSDRFGKAAKVQVCVSNLMLHINRALYESKQKNNPDKDNNLYRSLVQYIENHIDEDLSLERLSKVLYVSKYYIAHIFKDEMGLSIHQFITKRRLQMCKESIVAGNSINNACYQYGFTDYSVFYRAFKKEYGISPKKFRDEILRDVT